ncbi:hypothetical protein BDV23DRAFT_161986, partial [Aspergillus alliaceus]
MCEVHDMLSRIILYLPPLDHSAAPLQPCTEYPVLHIQEPRIPHPTVITAPLHSSTQHQHEL